MTLEIIFLDTVVQCAWKAANTVRQSNKKKKNSNRNNHCRWHALRSVRDSLSLQVGLQPTVAQLRRGGKERCPAREENGGTDL